MIEDEVFVTRSASRPTFSATLRIDRVISVIEEEVLSTAAESPSALPATCSTEADISSIEEELSPAREKRFSTLWTTDLMLAFICSIDEETVATASVCPEPPSAIRCETSAMSRETTSRSPNAARTFSNIARRFAVIRFSVAARVPNSSFVAIVIVEVRSPAAVTSAWRTSSPSGRLTKRTTKTESMATRPTRVNPVPTRSRVTSAASLPSTPAVA